MPFTDQHDRRYRRPTQAVAGHPDIPVYERHDDTMHAAGRRSAMARAMQMGTTGLWVVSLGGELTEIGGRCYWDTLEDVMVAAKRASISMSDLIIRTGA